MKELIQGINLEKEFEKLKEHWSPLVIGELDDNYLKIAKLKGDFVWHDHENEDELFYIVKGSMKLEFEDRTLELSEGEFYVVPRKTMHKPSAGEECWVFLIEKKTTAHTGNVITEKTRSIEDQLGE
jgi:mannose-6-phosphate isomerase-like protein (cupin superfamily)